MTLTALSATKPAIDYWSALHPCCKLRTPRALAKYRRAVAQRQKPVAAAAAAAGYG